MKRLSLVVVAMIFLAACDKNDEPDPQISLNYQPLSVGNYWVYNSFYIHPDGTENGSSRIDSVAITRDTIIRGEKYFVFETINTASEQSQWSISRIVRDSLSYLVNEKGAILFAENHFNEILYEHFEVSYNTDTVAELYYQMKDDPSTFTVPAGSFDVLNYQGEVISYLVPDPEQPAYFYLNNLYARDVGRVLRTSVYLTSGILWEQRLVRYHITE
ncbi:MAG: hypothetical protein ABR597_05335 [Bacteroidales bacterium]